MKKVFPILSATAFMFLISCNSSSTKTEEPKDTVMVKDASATNSTKVITKYKTVEVQPAVQTKFTEKYPKAADVQWVRYTDMPPVDIEWDWTGWPVLDSTDYAVNYNIDTTDYWSWYTPEGNWISTVTPVKSTEVPSAVNSVLQSQFANYTVTSVKRENDKNRTAYEIKMENGEDKMKVLIDENGNIMKKKGKENGQKTKEKMQ